MHVTTANVALGEVVSLLPNAALWDRFLQEQGPGTEVYLDPRSGIPSGIQLAVPLIPGRGKGNRVTLKGLGRALGKTVRKVDANVVGESLASFLRANHATLGIDLDQVGPVRATRVSDELWQLSAGQVVQGVPVRFARIGATVSHGNLILLGAEMWANARLDTHPKIDATTALQLGFAKVGGRRDEDVVSREPSLEIVPVAAPGRDNPRAPSGRPGDGYVHWLVWSFSFQRGDEPSQWEVVVDALKGEVVAIQDTSYDATRKIKGAVYPITNTEVCPSPDRCGVAQPQTPMSFADYQPQTYSNSGAVFNFIGTATTTLKGRYISVTDTCGSISESSTGDIEMGGGFPYDHDCTSAGASAGDTAASRTAAYEMDKIAEVGRGWLPGNLWLQGQPSAQAVKVNRQVIGGWVCNAVYDATSGLLSFGRGGTLLDGHVCRNPGEIATILDHEWGHALDKNDANLTMSNTSEAYADIAAMYRTQISCSGYGFITDDPADDNGCGFTQDMTGYNGNMSSVAGGHCLTDCSGFRDSDYTKHVPSTPDTPQNFVCATCPTTTTEQIGPCGLEVHCEAAPITQAAWDLAARDLQSAPFSYSSATAFNLANRLFYQGSGNVQSWHTCNCASGTSDGCAANSGYKQWLAADDDNGNLSDGTPHMSAIYAAFNRHNIACSTPTPQNGGCTGAPSAATNLTAVPGSFQTSLSWSSVPGASKYWVLRTEGQAGCNMGRAVIGSPTGTTFTDTEVADGRHYFYSVMAVGASDACSGPASSCTCATPYNGTPPADVVAASDYQTGPGTIFQGNYVNTRVEDASLEILRESLQGSVSRLNHIWKFTGVPDACLQFNFAGTRVKGTDNDNFQFAWAPDVGGAPGAFQDIPGALIDKTFFPAGGTTVPLGGPGAGSIIYIRVQDTNQVSGSTLDKVNIDHLAILPR